MSWTWQGRQLTKAVKDKTVTFTYDSEGIRTSKSDGTNTTKYLLNGTQILAQTTNGKTLCFFYDQQGNRVGMADSSNHFYYYIYNVQGDVIALADASTGKLAATYTYDAWGKIVKINGQNPEDVASTNIANINPFRYRGYYYDTETGLYYVSSRYYDPEIGRWINADGYVSTGQGVLGNNMFAYCGNNPVNRVDPTGQFWSEIWEFAKTAVAEIGKAMGVMSPAYAGCGGAAVADGPLPFGDIVAAAGAALLTVGAIGYGIYQATQAPAISIPKAEEKAEAIPAPPPTPIVIYRYGGTNPGNLTPKAKDKYTGLSFSTVPMPGAAMTTIEALNATGVVYAVQDGPTHVSVRPVGAPIEAWINAGSGSIWTQAVKSVVIKWDGGY